MRELIQLKNEPPEGIRIVTPEDNMLDVTGIIEGPGVLLLRARLFVLVGSVADQYCQSRNAI